MMRGLARQFFQIKSALIFVIIHVNGEHEAFVGRVLAQHQPDNVLEGFQIRALLANQKLGALGFDIEHAAAFFLAFKDFRLKAHVAEQFQNNCFQSFVSWHDVKPRWLLFLKYNIAEQCRTWWSQSNKWLGRRGNERPAEW